MKRFGETQALDGVDLSVERAKVLGVLGPNGAGKTTAVRIFTTLIRPDAGRAFIDGIDVLAEPMRAKARIGLTGQYAAVDERLTGAENLEHVGRLYHMPIAAARQRGRELLERFDLVDAGDRVVKGYSGGMRRRLDIAMSLIARPSVLFLDEPTTGLDPRSRQGVWELIEELVAGGTTTLLTTQYLDEADRLADEIVVIDHGRVIAGGTSAELKQQVGADRVEVTVRRRCRAGRAAETLAALGVRRRSSSTGAHRRGPGLRPRGQGARSGAPARRRRHRRRRRRRPTARRSTTSSSPSPATAPRTTGRTREDRSTHDARDDRHDTASTLDLAPAPFEDIPRGPVWLVKDSWTEATRHLRALPRNPELLMFATIQPLMFVVLFVYVFGGSVEHTDRLHAVRHPRHLRPDRAVQLGVHLRRRGRRPQQGHHRPAALAADVPGRPCSSGGRCRTSCATCSRSSSCSSSPTSSGSASRARSSRRWRRRR